MSELITTPNVNDPDGIYEDLVGLCAGLSPDEVARTYARLVLMLINHIGDAQAVREAIALAAQPTGRQEA